MPFDAEYVPHDFNGGDDNRHDPLKLMAVILEIRTTVNSADNQGLCMPCVMQTIITNLFAVILEHGATEEALNRLCTMSIHDAIMTNNLGKMLDNGI